MLHSLGTQASLPGKRPSVVGVLDVVTSRRLFRRRMVMGAEEGGAGYLCTQSIDVDDDVWPDTRADHITHAVTVLAVTDLTRSCRHNQTETALLVKLSQSAV